MRKIIGIKRILLIMIVVCAFAAFAGRQVFAADGWPDSVQDNGIPALVLSIEEQEFENVINSPDHSYSAETGSIKIHVPDGYMSEYTGEELADSKDIQLEYIRGRGHSSWWGTKKPFKIKLDKSQDLLGMGKNKHWVLLANAYDNSLIKNRLVGYMGRALGLDYTPKYIPVDFYVNDQYYGNYLLAQQVRIHETRVDIPELTADDNEEPAVTGGYLLSLHPYDDGPDVIKTNRGVEFQAEEPSFAPGETGTAAQHDYISGYLQNLEDAIYSDTDSNDKGSACAEYMDLRSTARYWWVQVFTKNVDAYATTSTYLYKDRDSKLYWGPLWDFDYSCSGKVSGFSCEMEWLEWMRYFDYAYQQELLAGWEDYDGILEEITAEDGVLDQYAAEIEQSWKANYIRWNPDVDPEDDAAIDAAFTDAVSNLRTFLNERRAWVNNNPDELYGTYYTATFKGEGKEDVINYYKGGTYINLTSILKDEFQRDGYVFLGWMDEDGNLVNDYVELTEDRVFTAKYVSEEEATLPNGLYFPEQVKWCSLDDGTYYYLGEEYMITPEIVDDDTIHWTSSDESVAYIDRDFVMFKKAGTTVITGTTRSGVKNSFTLHIINGDVDGDIEDFSFAHENMALKPGAYGQNVITFYPADKPFSTSMTYTSSDDSIATVNEMGVVEAKEEGVCTITAADYWSDLEKSYTLTVTTDQVTTPVLDPEPGTYAEAQNVTISCETAGADIYYTTDGSEPATSSTKYADAISVTETTTIKAIAVKEGMVSSEVATAEYIISEPAPATKTSIEGSGVSGIKAKTWTGKALTQSLTVKLSGKALKSGTDYTVTYKNNKNIGKATLTITGQGSYTGTITKTFKINPKGTSIKRLTKAKKAIKVKWKKQSKKMSKSRITGCQIQLATNKKFTKNKKTVTVKGYKKVSRNVKKLKGKKKYYVRVRTYKTVNGVKYYSPWSKVRTVKTR